MAILKRRESFEQSRGLGFRGLGLRGLSVCFVSAKKKNSISSRTVFTTSLPSKS